MSLASGKPSARHPLLVAYLAQLTANPLRTKALTTGILCFLQEVLASHFAGVPAQRLSKESPLYYHALARARVDTKALKMGLYGLLVSAPLGHVLIGALQRAFAGKTGRAARLGQILSSNLFIAPIQTAVYLASMAVVNGAKSVDEIVKTVKGGFFSVIRVMWVSSPLSIIFAQTFLAPELWVPFFNLVGFTMGTYFNTRVKQIRLAVEKKQKKDEQDK